MQVIACVFRIEEGECEGECLLKNKPCDGCQEDLPFFINWEEYDD